MPLSSVTILGTVTAQFLYGATSRRGACSTISLTSAFRLRRHDSTTEHRASIAAAPR